MGNTTKIQGRFLQIKGLDVDWSLPGDLASFDKSGIQVKSIRFHPSGVNDVFIIKEAAPGYATTAALVTALTATAPAMFRAKCAGDTDDRIQYYGGDRGQRMRPFIDITDCTLSSAALAFIEMELA